MGEDAISKVCKDFVVHFTIIFVELLWHAFRGNKMGLR